MIPLPSVKRYINIRVGWTAPWKHQCISEKSLGEITLFLFDGKASVFHRKSGLVSGQPGLLLNVKVVGPVVAVWRFMMLEIMPGHSVLLCDSVFPLTPLPSLLSSASVYPIHSYSYRHTSFALWRILANNLSPDGFFINTPPCFTNKHDCRWRLTAKSCFSFSTPFVI